ncbi:Y-family DNA polymerase [Falsirhodobacter halotolerans]|uniref:Y-family DNA polymerase n=1 Tax=Falsirhodobacter halotolerans TaxID=1146892 RepID=UPI001FD08B73|nr:DNA polymerase Y family protein [Falsirhodobacter halotolerans]MCJ8141194.1 DNA polymerase Y family protein [Falsirhodobacter halotolerans]
MARVISVFLPTWPTDRLRRRVDSAPSAERPLITAGRIGNRRLVIAADAGALALGLHVGMPVSKAQALAPGLLIEAANPKGDAESLERLALWVVERVSPMVAVDPPDGLVIDSTGADHLHGGEAEMIDALLGRLLMSGVTARIAIADTWGAAHALARFAADPTYLADPGQTDAALAPLPLDALRLPPAVVSGLHDLGFSAIGDFLGQPRGPLTRRFGPELWRRLDQAFGDAAEPIVPLRPEGLIEVRRTFFEPIGAAETIARYIGKLVAALCAALEERGLGARRLDLMCHRVDNRTQAVRVGLAVPQRDPARLTRLLCDKIETIAPGFGIEIMTLAATLAEPLGATQVSSLDATGPDLSGLIDVLANRVGPRGIYRMAPVASDVPERSARRVAPLAEDTGAGWPDHWPRPSRLLRTPEPIETLALLPDHPPNWIAWRGIRHRIRRADGPERIFGEWWARDAEMIAVRDYFRIENEAGERYWIFRAGDGEDAATGSHRWFLHGVFG